VLLLLQVAVPRNLYGLVGSAVDFFSNWTRNPPELCQKGSSFILFTPIKIIIAAVGIVVVVVLVAVVVVVVVVVAVVIAIPIIILRLLTSGIFNMWYAVSRRVLGKAFPDRRYRILGLIPNLKSRTDHKHIGSSLRHDSGHRLPAVAKLYGVPLHLNCI